MRSTEFFGGVTPSESTTDALLSLKDRRQPRLSGIRGIKEEASSETVPRMEALLGTRASPQQKGKIHFEKHEETFGISPSPDDQAAGGNQYRSAFIQL